MREREIAAATTTLSRVAGTGVPTLTEIVETLHAAMRVEVGDHLARWLDRLDATGRWALLKLVTGSLRVGVSARLAKLALAEWSGQDIAAIEEVWHGLAPPTFPCLPGLKAVPLSPIQARCRPSAR